MSDTPSKPEPKELVKKPGNIKRLGRFILVGSLAGVAIGVAGVVAESTFELVGISATARYINGLSSIWTALFIVVTLPLVVVFILRSILALGDSRVLGRIGLAGTLLHVVLMVLGFWLTVGIDQAVLPVLFPVQFTEFGSINGEELSSLAILGQEISLGWVSDMRKLASSLIMPVLIVTIIIGLVILAVLNNISMRIMPILERSSHLLLQCLYSLLLFMPIAVIGVVFTLAKGYGATLLTTVVVFIIFTVLMCVLFIALLYLVGYLFGSLPPGHAFKAMGQTYLLAASTRSSYACIASVTECAHGSLGFDKDLAESSIPFFLITFRANRGFLSILNLQFLVHCFGGHLELSVLLSYLLLAIFASIGSPGLPSSTRYTTLPFYVAAGVPVEAYVFMRSVDDIPDIFKTMLNVTYPIVLLSMALRLQAVFQRFKLQV